MRAYADQTPIFVALKAWSTLGAALCQLQGQILFNASPHSTYGKLLTTLRIYVVILDIPKGLLIMRMGAMIKDLLLIL